MGVEPSRVGHWGRASWTLGWDEQWELSCLEFDTWDVSGMSMGLWDGMDSGIGAI